MPSLPRRHPGTLDTPASPPGPGQLPAPWLGRAARRRRDRARPSRSEWARASPTPTRSGSRPPASSGAFRQRWSRWRCPIT